MTGNEKKLILYLLPILIAGLLFLSFNRYRFYCNYVDMGIGDRGEIASGTPGRGSERGERGRNSLEPPEKTGLTAREVRSDTGKGEAALPPSRSKTVDVNRADLDSLMSLPGVGRATALSIIEYRTANGGFKTVDELLEVKGIGEKKLEAIRGLVSVE